MNDIEQHLREALRRQEPSDGFAGRVMARVPVAMPARRMNPPGLAQSWRRHWTAAAAAACLVVVGGGAWEHHRRQLEGERAKQELIYALTVASGKLETTKQILTR